MRYIRSTLALIIALTLGCAVALYCLERPDIHTLLASLPLFLMTFLATHLWHHWRHQRHETLYRQLLRQLPVRLHIRTPRGRLLLENHPGERYEIPLQGQLPLRSEQTPEALSPASHRAWQSLRQVLASGQRQEVRFELPADAGRPALAYRQICFPIFGPGRHITALGSLLIDESELRATANALRILSDGLERQVAERTRELAAAKEAAERQAELQAEFMAHLSHEIRSPLSALGGLVQLAQRNRHDWRLDGYLEKLCRATEHLMDIVNEVLDFSRLDAGRLTINQVAFNPAELLWKAVDMVGEDARAKGLAIGVEHDEQLPECLHGDPLRISQILINLASNAIKFTERGRIDFRMRLLTRTTDGVRLRLEVQDTGCGISTEHMPLLFEPFRQLPAPSGAPPGTGLGLAISARLARLMGGDLRVSSTPGEGSLFYLELELASHCDERGCTCAAPPERGLDPSPRRFAGHRVLLVDDDPLMREVAAELLQTLGLRVCIAADGCQALGRLREETGIELVCMDLRMPNMDGLETTRRLRQLWPNLPVIAISGNTRDSDRKCCKMAGMNDFLAKPVTLGQLTTVLQRWLPAIAERPLRGAATNLPPLPTIAGLDQVGALERMLGNHTLYLRLLRRFLEEYEALPNTLLTLLADGRHSQAGDLLHRFKSLAATLGADELRALGAQLEAALRAGGDTTDCLTFFAAEHQRLWPILRRALVDS